VTFNVIPAISLLHFMFVYLYNFVSADCHTCWGNWKNDE